MPPLIQLRDYFFDQIHFEVNLENLTTQQADLEDNLHLEVDWDRTPSDADQEALDRMVFHFGVRLNQDRKTTPDATYRLHLQVTALFDLARPSDLPEGTKPADHELHCVSSAIATVIGPIREMVASLTSRTPAGRLVLPSLSPLAVASRVIARRRSADENS